MTCEDAGVVAVALTRSRVARDAVLHQALRTLVDRAREIDAGHADAFPEVRLRGQPALAEGLDAQLSQVAQRCGEPGGRDDIVDEKLKRLVISGAHPDVKPVCCALDLLDRR